MADVSKKKRSRAGIVGYINKLIKGEIAKICVEYTSEQLMILMCYKDTIEEKLKKVLTLSEEIQDTMNDDEFQEDFEKYTDIEVSVRRDLSTLANFIENKQKSSFTLPIPSTNPVPVVEKSSGNVKLPRLEIKKFNGDPTRWKSFIESFDAAVHANKSLSNIEKMNFLVNYVEDEAENVIKGLLLSNDNYLVAKDMLQERYGDPQMLITAHMGKLLNLDVVTDITNIKELRSLYDEVETQVRSLEGLKLDSKQYGPMLTPVLLSKLPSEFQLIISRNFGKTVWNIENILKFFNTELVAREKINFGNLDRKLFDTPATGSALFANASQTNQSRNPDNRLQRKSKFGPNNTSGKQTDRRKECIFCNNRNHDTTWCNVVTRPDARKSILYKQKCCFKCFKPSHSAAECWRNIKCYKCRGAHHTSICTFENRKGRNHEYVPRNPIGYHNVNQQPYSVSFEQGYKQYPTNPNGVYFNPGNTPPPNDIDNQVCNPSFNVGVPSPNVNMVNSTQHSSVLLQTAIAQASSTDKSNFKNFRILFDNGSQLTYITPNARSELDLRTLGKHKQVTKTFGNAEVVNTYDIVEFIVKSRNGRHNISVSALVGDICLPLGDQQIDQAKRIYPHLRDLQLADNNPGSEPLSIDILVGCDHYDKFMLDQKVRGFSGPTAVSSHLGFVLRGKMDAVSVSTTNIASVHALQVETRELPNHIRDVKNILGMENLNPKGNNLGVYENFQNSTVFVNERYQVRLPFQNREDVLGDNYKVARARLRSLYADEFKNNLELLRDYDNIIQDQKNSNIIEYAESLDGEGKVGEVFYMPHKPVIREAKSSTKVRMVFDGSSCSKKSDTVSLNDHLFSGPSLATPLLDVIIRFRAFYFVIIADIEKAFLQISLAPEHRDFVRFLWFKSIESIDAENFDNNEISEFRVCRVLFGLKPSPFLLIATLIKHIMSYAAENPIFAGKLLESLHVDDLNSGYQNIDDAFNFYEWSKIVLSTAHFNLRKFKSNSDELENRVYEKYPDDKLFTEDKKVLGLTWDKHSDDIIFDFTEIRAKLIDHPTKRQLLRSIASIYDPPNLINPCIVKMKNLFQDVCAAKTQWDSELPSEFMLRWKKILHEFEEVVEIHVPRKYCSKNEVMCNVELHAFSDASQRNYAAAIYVRVVYASGVIETSLVNSKSRVLSKTGKMTIPRAELLGALLMAEQSRVVYDALKSVYCISNIYFWIDSAIVYSWILNKNTKYDAYITKRLDKIREIIPPPPSDQLRLVPSKLNPADIGTRGMSPKELLNSRDFWFGGPEFLKLREDSWPKLKVGEKFDRYQQNIVENPSSVLVAESADVSSNFINSNDSVGNDDGDNYNYKQIDIGNIIDIKRFSTLNKLYRVTAFVIRFKNKLLDILKRKKENRRTNDTRNNIKSIIDDNVLTSNELIQSKLLWVKSAQQSVTIDDRKFKQLKHQLDLFCDDNGLWRCGGRMQNAVMNYDMKYPIMLTKDSYFTKLVVINSHVSVKHNGPKETLCNMRTEFWITQPRNFIKKIIKECFLCKYMEGKSYDYPKIPPLPNYRVTKDFAFSYTGIDYAGPLYVKNIFCKHPNVADVFKCWIALFTCANSRSVFLDLVYDSSAEACVSVLQRFISSRGAPKVFISDNGSAFISNHVQDFVASKCIQWKFNTDAAPWTGGFFERMVKSVKRCLKKVIFNARLNYEELLTILKEVENVVNNRPLVYVYDDVNQDILTPNKLLFGRNLETNAPNSEVKIENDLSKRKKYTLTLLEHWWSRWHVEYLTELREYHKFKIKDRSLYPRVGDIVLVYDEKLKRSDWRVGRIRELTSSRSATVLMKKTGKLIRRPINRLYPIVENE